MAPTTNHKLRRFTLLETYARTENGVVRMVASGHMLTVAPAGHGGVQCDSVRSSGVLRRAPSA
jgi:hypothetical protein